MYEGNISVFENKQVGELKGNKPAPEKKKKKKSKETVWNAVHFMPGVSVCSRCTSVFQNEVQFVPGVSQKKE